MLDGLQYVVKMASPDNLLKRIQELEDIVKKCNSQIEILSDKVQQLEKGKQPTPNRRACSNQYAVKRNKRNPNYDFDSSSSDGSFYTNHSRTKGLVCSKDVYKEVLQENHKALIDDLDLNNTFVLDILISDDVLSMSDKDCIKSKPTTKGKTRELLLKLVTYGEEKFHKFCSAIEPEYPCLSKRLRSSFRKKISSYASDVELTSCFYCTLRDQVDPNDIIDDLYANKVINAKTTKLISKEKNPDIAWKEIQHHINGCSDHFNVLCEALTNKYQHIQRQFNETRTCTLKCTCKEIIQNRDNLRFNNHCDPPSSRTSPTSLDSTAEKSESNQMLYDIQENQAIGKQADTTREKRQYVSLDSKLSSNLSRYLDDVEQRNKDYEGSAPFDKIKYYSLPVRLGLKSGERNPNLHMGRVGEENSEADDSDAQSNLDSISTNIDNISIGVEKTIPNCSEKKEILSEMAAENIDIKMLGGSQGRQVFHRRAFKRRKREQNNS